MFGVMSRLHELNVVAAEMGAHVDLRIYPGMDHTIDKLQKVRAI